MLLRLFSSLLVILAVNSMGIAQLPNPALDHIYPPGGQAGTTVLVRVGGRDLDQGRRLVFSHPGITGSSVTRPAAEFETTSQTVSNQFKVTIPLNVPPGSYDVRLEGRFGISTPRTFVVSEVDELYENNDHSTPDTATALPLDAVMNGRADASAVDYYRFSAAKNQNLVIECLAANIDSHLAPVITIWSIGGRQLRRSKQLVDPILEFVADEPGDYILGINDHVYAGGGTHAYRLQIHSGPYLLAISPTVARPGRTANFTVHGRNLPGGQLDKSLRWEGRPLQRTQVTLFVPSPDTLPGSNIVAPVATTTEGFRFRWPSAISNSRGLLVAYASHAVVVETEPNNSPQSAQKVAIPCDYSGRFYPRRDQDWIQFSANKGEAYQVQVVSNRWGHPTDPEVLVQRVVRSANGKDTVSQVATQDDFKSDQKRYQQPFRRGLDLSHRDPVVRFKADHDCEYRVGLRDLNGGSIDDPRFDYQLIVERQRPDFEILAWTQLQAADDDRKIDRKSMVLRRGASLPVLVDVLRQGGFDQEVVVTASQLPRGVTAGRCLVPSDKTEGIMVLTASDDAEAWCGPIKIVGDAVIKGQLIRRFAREAVLIDNTDNIERQRPSARQARQLLLAVIDHETPLARLEVADSTSDDVSRWETCVGAHLAIPVSFVTYGQLKGDITLGAIGLPEKVKADPLTLKPSATDATIKLSLADEGIQPGMYTIFLRGTLKGDYARNPRAIATAQEARSRFDKVMDELNGTVDHMKSRLAEARRQLDEAKDEVARAEERFNDLAAKQKRATAHAKLLDERLANAKKILGPKEINSYISSPSVTLEVLNSPLMTHVPDEPLTLKKGTSCDVKIRIQRRFGFAEAVELQLQLPEGLEDIHATTATIAKEHDARILTLTAGPAASIGRHTLQLQQRLTFNGVNIQDHVPLQVTIQE